MGADPLLALVLDDTGKTAFQNYLNNGGNFVGIHSASGTLNTTTFYGQELGEEYSEISYLVLSEPELDVCEGAYFDYHPELQNAVRSGSPWSNTQ